MWGGGRAPSGECPEMRSPHTTADPSGLSYHQGTFTLSPVTGPAARVGVPVAPVPEERPGRKVIPTGVLHHTYGRPRQD